jgi:Fe-S-cluster containining protein
MAELGPVNEYRVINNSKQASKTLRAIYANECQRCGGCCVRYALSPFRIPVWPDDNPPKKLVQIGPRMGRGDHSTSRYMRIVPLPAWKGFGQCVALEGFPSRNVKCGIYEQRGSACSSYDPGSPSCLLIRHWMHLPDPEDALWLGRS